LLHCIHGSEEVPSMGVQSCRPGTTTQVFAILFVDYLHVYVYACWILCSTLSSYTNVFLDSWQLETFCWLNLREVRERSTVMSRALSKNSAASS
jgi:hypothetical protein